MEEPWNGAARMTCLYFLDHSRDPPPATRPLRTNSPGADWEMEVTLVARCTEACDRRTNSSKTFQFPPLTCATLPAARETRPSRPWISSTFYSRVLVRVMAMYAV